MGTWQRMVILVNANVKQNWNEIKWKRRLRKSQEKLSSEQSTKGSSLIILLNLPEISSLGQHWYETGYKMNNQIAFISRYKTTVSKDIKVLVTFRSVLKERNIWNDAEKISKFTIPSRNEVRIKNQNRKVEHGNMGTHILSRMYSSMDHSVIELSSIHEEVSMNMTRNVWIKQSRVTHSISNVRGSESEMQWWDTSLNIYSKRCVRQSLIFTNDWTKPKDKIDF